jgi:hypothetical protein
MRRLVNVSTVPLILFVVHLSISQAFGVTATGFAGDDVAAAAYNSFTQVWIPIIALIVLGGVIIAIYTGHRVIAKVAGLVFVIVLLGGGLPYLSKWSGGTIAAGATLHEERP